MSRTGKFLLLIAAITVLSASTLALAGCGPSKGTNNSEIEQSGKTTENVKNNEEDTKIVEKYKINLQLESFSLPGVFSMDKPKGWKVYKAGEYNTFAFLTRD